MKIKTFMVWGLGFYLFPALTRLILVGAFYLDNVIYDLRHR